MTSGRRGLLDRRRGLCAVYTEEFLPYLSSPQCSTPTPLLLFNLLLILLHFFIVKRLKHKKKKKKEKRSSQSFMFVQLDLALLHMCLGWVLSILIYLSVYVFISIHPFLTAVLSIFTFSFLKYFSNEWQILGVSAHKYLNIHTFKIDISLYMLITFKLIGNHFWILLSIYTYWVYS